MLALEEEWLCFGISHLSLYILYFPLLAKVAVFKDIIAQAFLVIFCFL